LDDLGLAAALKAECEAFSQVHKIHTAFRSNKGPKSIPANVALCCYRIAQESLQNIAKHSGAQTVRVDLAFQSGRIQLAIEDFGNGFDVQAQRRKRRGLGLIGMEERVRLLGGRLTIDSKPGRGTRVMASIPLKNER
jgi:signal transduction histidine kinase